MSNVTDTSVPLSVAKGHAKDLVGPLVLGTFINITLFGSLLMQTQTFYRHATNDPMYLKVVVAVLLLVDTLNSFIAAYIAYDYAVTDFGNVDKILVVTPPFAVLIVTIALSGSIVQAFFGLRVKMLTKRTWLGALIITTAIISFLCGVGVMIAGTIVKDFEKFHKFSSIVIVWLVLGPVTDIAISGSLVQHLRKIQTGFPSTDDMLSKITKMVIQTGAITVVWATVDLILFLTVDTNLHFIFNIPLAKLYANCMLSSLNAREQWRAEGSGVTHNWPIPAHGVNINTNTGVHRDEIELENASTDPSRHRTRVARSIPPPPNFIDIKKENIITSQHHTRTEVQSDGLSLDSDSDLEQDVTKDGRPDRRVDWRGML